MAMAAPADPAAPASSPPPPLSPVGFSEADRAKILESVQQIQKDFDKQKHDVTAGGLSRFVNAAASELAAVEFYLACQKIVQDRTPDLDNTNDKQEAKIAQDRVKQQVKDYEAAPGRATAVKIQLEYLVLTLQSPTVKDQAALIAKARDMVGRAMIVVKTYASPNAEPLNIKKLAAGTGSNRGKAKAPSAQQRTKEEDRTRRQIIQTMKQNVMNTIFSQAYNLKSYFKPVENWAESPLALDSIYEEFALPYFRENKRDDLLTVWEEYEGHQLALHRCEEDDQDFAKWGITGYKNLLWHKWMDMLTYGNRKSQSLDELTKLIKDNPSHPDVDSWVKDLAAFADALQPPGTPKTDKPQDAEASK